MGLGILRYASLGGGHMSVIGTTVFKMSGNPYHTPEFRRGGLSVRIPIDTLQLLGGPTVSYQIQSRNSEETTFTNNGSPLTVTQLGTGQLEASGVREILRVELTFDAADEAGFSVAMAGGMAAEPGFWTVHSTAAMYRSADQRSPVMDAYVESIASASALESALFHPAGEDFLKLDEDPGQPVFDEVPAEPAAEEEHEEEEGTAAGTEDVPPEMPDDAWEHTQDEPQPGTTVPEAE
jgi:hypothetical protein